MQFSDEEIDVLGIVYLQQSLERGEPRDSCSVVLWHQEKGPTVYHSVNRRCWCAVEDPAATLNYCIHILQYRMWIVRKTMAADICDEKPTSAALEGG